MRVILTLLLMVALFAGCGGGGSTSSEPSEFVLTVSASANACSTISAGCDYIAVYVDDRYIGKVTPGGSYIQTSVVGYSHKIYAEAYRYTTYSSVSVGWWGPYIEEFYPGEANLVLGE